MRMVLRVAAAVMVAPLVFLIVLLLLLAAGAGVAALVGAESPGGAYYIVSALVSLAVTVAVSGAAWVASDRQPMAWVLGPLGVWVALAAGGLMVTAGLTRPVLDSERGPVERAVVDRALKRRGAVPLPPDVTDLRVRLDALHGPLVLRFEAPPHWSARWFEATVADFAPDAARPPYDPRVETDWWTPPPGATRRADPRRLVLLDPARGTVWFAGRVGE